MVMSVRATDDPTTVVRWEWLHDVFVVPQKGRLPSSARTGMAEEQRYRLLVLGAHRTGKTCLIRKYLYNMLPDKYKETVEDSHSRDFYIGKQTLALDVVETSVSYPDMRRLAIQQAHAFMLVFAVDDVVSFRYMSDLWDEIAELRREEILAIPAIIVGNKTDIEPHKITASTVEAWMESRKETGPWWTSRLRYCPTSALNGDGLVAAFRKLLELSEFAGIKEASSSSDASSVQSPSSDGGPPSAFKTNTLLESKNNLNRHRSFRVGRKAEKDKQQQQAAAPPVAAASGGGESTVKRTGSLLRRGMGSIRRKHKHEVIDESDCKIS